MGSGKHIAIIEDMSTSNILYFMWWNVQDFAHFDFSQSHYDRWPKLPQEYEEKCRRVDRVLQAINRKNLPALLGLAEITSKAAHDLRDRLYPTYKVFTLGDFFDKPDFHLAIIYDPDSGIGEEDFLIASNLPNTTRPMLVINHRNGRHVIRFYLCHWTARFSEASRKWRYLSAGYLNNEAYKFLHPSNEAGETRHVIILGDLNEEPYGQLEEWLYAYRHRAPSRYREHPTDKAIKRVRLYNCTWRLMGEHYPHPIPAGEREMAGSYYWREERSWHTFDQIIVSGSLLTSSPPYIDEKALEIVSRADVLPDDFLGDDKMPQKFHQDGGRFNGLSDHLPLCGRIIVS